MARALHVVRQVIDQCDIVRIDRSEAKRYALTRLASHGDNENMFTSKVIARMSHPRCGVYRRRESTREGS